MSTHESDEYPCRVLRSASAVVVDLYEPVGVVDPLEPARRLAAEAIAQEGAARAMIRVRSGSKLPPAAARAANGQWLRVNGARFQGAVYLEGEGFWSAAFRAAISGMVALSGRRAHISVASTLDDAIAAIIALPAEREVVRAFYARGTHHDLAVDQTG